ncbi:MAG: hypothetical protein GY943_39275 [Chloroflexi bacterium]|nr:hypothetical protein [Chloroflexota bacterium]
MNNLDQIIQIKDEQVDKTAVLHTIQTYLQQLPPDEMPFPTYELTLAHYREDGHFSPALFSRLTQLHEKHDRLWVEPDTQTQPTGWIQRLMGIVKRPFHQISTYYVNKLAQQQLEINNSTHKLINQLILELQQPDPHIAELKAQIADLEKQLAQEKNASNA